jgi:protein required for attachment to host cells
MNVRIVVADEREANFFDASRPNAPLIERGSLHNAAAGLKDQDLESDRAGRRYGGTSGVSHGGGLGQSHHHGVNGERSSEAHELTVFAKEIAKQIEAGRTRNEFDRFVLVAGPKMLGLLRKSLPLQASNMLAGEVSKDLVHEAPAVILKTIPREAFGQVQ